MASLKALKDRIGSVKSTQKITKAKQMVAAAKLRKAQAAAEEARPYAERLASVMAALASKVSGDDAPKLLAGTGSDKRHLLVVVNTDKGLCGGLNSNLVRAAAAKAQELEAAGKDVEFYLVGKKGRAPLKRNFPNQIGTHFDTSDVRYPGFDEAAKIADELVEMYEAGKFDIAHLVYPTFKSALAQDPTIDQIVPVPTSAPNEATGSDDKRNIRLKIAKDTLSRPFEDAVIEHIAEESLGRPAAEMAVNAKRSEAVQTLAQLDPKPVEYEPGEEEILEELLPRYVKTQLFGALLEIAASEQGASMTAMDNATRNAGDLINKLTIQYNRSRQAAITTELIEIIAGAEAL